MRKSLHRSDRESSLVCAEHSRGTWRYIAMRLCVWHSLDIEVKMKDKISRVIREAFLVRIYDDKYVSAPSINLHPEELAFLRDYTA